MFSFIWLARQCGAAIVLLLLLAQWIFLAQSSHAETRPSGVFAPDRAVTLAVDLALQQEPGVSAHLIDVETRDGIVNLTGTVDNLLAKERATDVVESVRGVTSVVNRVKVNRQGRCPSGA